MRIQLIQPGLMVEVEQLEIYAFLVVLAFGVEEAKRVLLLPEKLLALDA